MGNVADNLFEAIETLAKNEIHKAGFDKTIQATVVSCVDAKRAIYKVRYQDAYFNAYGDVGGTTYRANDSVYILVPKNDMSLDKKIIGLVKKITSVQEEQDELYDEIDHCIEIGANGLIDDWTYPNQKIQLFTSAEGDEEQIIIYDENVEGNLKIDQQAILSSLKESNTIKLSADFKVDIDINTDINGEEGSGNFGLLFQIEYINKSTEDNQIVTKTIKLDNTQFLGYPYSISKFSTRFMLVDYDADEFEFSKITKIILFAKKFNVPVLTLPEPKIQVKNLKFIGCYKFTPQELNSTHVELTYTTGNFFSEHFTGPLKMEAKLVQGQTIIANDVSHPIHYFWFRENCKIEFNDYSYCSYGGVGWECLNDFKDGSWQSASSIYDITKDKIKVKEQKFKCVSVRDNIAYERIFNVYNYTDTAYDLSLVFDPNNKIEKTETKPIDVSVYFSGEKEEGVTYKYYWLSKRCTFASAKEKIYSEHLYRITDNEHVYISAGNILDGATIACALYKGEEYIGTTSSGLTVIQADNINYEMYIINAQQSFIYTENGDSPTKLGTGINYTTIFPLKFQILDKFKQEWIDGETACSKKAARAIWLIPTQNTLIKPTNDTLYPQLLDANGQLWDTTGAKRQFYIIEGNMCSFKIADGYDYDNYDNQIELRVYYKGQLLRAITNFYFGKQGEVGTTGTPFSLNVRGNGNNPYRFPIVTKRINNGYYTNFYKDITKPIEDNDTEWFTAQIVSRLPEIQPEDIQVTLDSIKFNFVGKDAPHHISRDRSYKSFVNVSDSGNFTISTVAIDHAGDLADLRDIIQIHAISQDGMHHYNYVPLTTIVMPEEANDYFIDLMNGYNLVQYNSSGKNPQYVNSNFTLKVVTKDNEDKEVDITDSCSYEWKLILSNTSVPSFRINTFIEKYKLPANQFSVSPQEQCSPDDYSTAVFCIVKYNGNLIGTIHIPIFCYLNLYSQQRLNDWDGNSLVMDKDNGYVTAVQVAAGTKNDSNQFTGVTMGVYKDGRTIENGLRGQVNGEKSFFLDAETGRLEIGTHNSGQLIFEPGDTKSLLIKSSLYENNQGGMLLNFGQKPSIKYGNGNFEVDYLGRLSCKGADIQGDFFAGNSRGNYIKLSSGNYPIMHWHYEEDGCELDINNAEITIQGEDGRIALENGQLSIEGNFTWIKKDDDYSGYVSFSDNGIIMNYQNTKDDLEFSLNSSELYLGFVRDSKKPDKTGTSLQYSNGNLKITGHIEATSGEIGGWRIEQGRIYSLKSSPKDEDLWNGIIMNARTGSITQQNEFIDKEDNFKSVISSFSTKEKVVISGGVIEFFAKASGSWYLQGAIYTRNNKAIEKGGIHDYYGTSMEGAISLSSRKGTDSKGSPVIIGAANDAYPNGELIAMFFPDNDDKDKPVYGNESGVKEVFSERCLCLPIVKGKEGEKGKYIQPYSTKVYRDKIQSGDYYVPAYYLKNNNFLRRKYRNKYDEGQNNKDKATYNGEAISIFEMMGVNTPKRITYTNGSSHSEETFEFEEKNSGKHDTKTFTNVTTDQITLQYIENSQQQNQFIYVYVQNKGDEDEKVVAMRLPTREYIDLSGF